MASMKTKKFKVGDSTSVNEFAPEDFRGRHGHVTEIGPGDAEYRVEFEDDQRPTTGYLMASWLEPRDQGADRRSRG